MALLAPAAWAQGLPAAKPTQVALPVLATPLPKGTIVAEADLSTTLVPAAKVFESTVQTPQQLVGMQTLRPLGAGQPISRLHLRTPPTISRGQLVPFLYSRGTVRLGGQAQALEDAQKGQSIRLLNLATRATLVGTVQPDGSVVIE